jgi:hypothetical protein
MEKKQQKAAETLSDLQGSHSSLQQKLDLAVSSHQAEMTEATRKESEHAKTISK